MHLRLDPLINLPQPVFRQRQVSELKRGQLMKIGFFLNEFAERPFPTCARK
jgi:hypothetical protein